MLELGQLPLEVQPAAPWQPDIQYQAAGRVAPLALQELLRRPERQHFQCDRAQQPGQSGANGRIVDDDEDDGLLLAHETPPGPVGGALPNSPRAARLKRYPGPTTATRAPAGWMMLCGA